MFHKKNVLVAAMITIMVLSACVSAPAATPAPRPAAWKEARITDHDADARRRAWLFGGGPK